MPASSPVERASAAALRARARSANEARITVCADSPFGHSSTPDRWVDPPTTAGAAGAAVSAPSSLVSSAIANPNRPAPITTTASAAATAAAGACATQSRTERILDDPQDPLVPPGLHVHRGTPVRGVEVLVGQPAGEAHVVAGAGAQLVHRVVEPLAGEREAHVGEELRRLHERDLALLDERGPVDPAHRERLPLLRPGLVAERVRHAVMDHAHARNRDRRVALDLAEAVLGVG